MIIEPALNDTIFIVGYFNKTEIKKYFFIKNKIFENYNCVKCDFYQQNNNCISLFNFKFQNNKFEQVDFEITNSSTFFGFVYLDENELKHTIKSKKIN